MPCSLQGGMVPGECLAQRPGPSGLQALDRLVEPAEPGQAVRVGAYRIPGRAELSLPAASEPVALYSNSPPRMARE